VKRPSYEEADEKADERPASEHTEILVLAAKPVFVKSAGPQYEYCVSDVVLLKTLLPRLVTESGIVIDISEVAPRKAELPILVTELGIVIDVSDVAL
jgi:hypothetical protein